MRPQTMYRAEAKKAKPTKMEKAWNHIEKVKRRAEARKKEAAAKEAK